VLVGTRARREECVACHKQVFLAERIVVGFPGQLRHRTCFRCDRCAAQLTLASYYETEKGQFCCETCPDEERNVYSGEDNDDDELLSISKSAKEGECSSDSDASSDSDLEENTSLRYERRSRSRTPPPPSPRTLHRSRSKTPPPPSPRTVFLKESLQSSTTSPSDVVPPAKPPRSLIQDTYVSNFSEMSPALCGKNSQPPSLTLDNILTTTPISCDNAKGHETCQSCDTLDTGQNIQTDNTNIVASSISQNKLLPNSKSDMKNEMQKEIIIENKVKSVRAIFEDKIVKSVENDKDKHAAKFILIDDKSSVDLESNVKNLKPVKSEEANDLKNNKNHEFDEEKEPVAQKSSSDIVSTDMSVYSHSDDIFVDKPSLGLPDTVLVCNVVATSKDKLSSDSALESDASESHPVDTSEIPSIVISSDISIISDDKENQHGAISDSNIIVNNFDNKNTEDLDSNFDEKVDSKISSNLNRDIVDNLETKSDDNSSTEDSINAKSSNTEHMEASEKEYPDELNPFGSDDDESKVEKVRSVKEFSKEVDSSTELRIVSSANIDKKNVKATPFNPFDSDEDEAISEENKEKTAPENAKKKSLNPFWSDEEAEEESSPKKKVKPPRPPPPSLKYETMTKKKKYILPSSPYQDIHPPSPSLSSKSSSSDQSTLRLKKKLRQAPAPPSPALSTSLLSSSNETDEIKDEALSAKLQKDLRNHNSKLRGDGNHQRDDVSSPVSMKGTISTPKSERGEWRRKKGPAPSRPVPQKRAIRKLPMRQVAQELQDIEVKQTELERQGVILETAIRERTEGPSSIKSLPSESGSPNDSLSTSSEAEKSLQSLNSGTSTHPSMEVEDMILQLFELVNEKNELFRRQTELMYLKREKRLEEEHAELEYQIRCLMLKHPSERTEDDGKIEEELISRLLKVVEQRDAVVNCLEMERQREAIEDESIAKHMIKYQEKHVEGIDSDEERERVAKKKKKKLRLLKKKKKKEKDREKVSKVDADKDIDETEVKKKKKNWFKKSPLSSVI
ncbi:MICAL C-terminal-like protein, partial [Armadillidium nasatum]